MNKVGRALSGYRVPRPKTKIDSMNDAGALVSSIYTTPLLATPAGGQFASQVMVSPASYGSLGDAGGAVIRNYSDYKMKRAVLTYTPAVGTTTTGIVHLAYTDSAEVMYKWLTGAYSDATKLGICKSSSMHVSGPVWMQLSLAASMQTRRPKYSVNYEITGVSQAEIDLQCHGMFIVCTEGVPVSTTYGMVAQEYTVQAYHLQSQYYTGV